MRVWAVAWMLAFVLSGCSGGGGDPPAASVDEHDPEEDGHPEAPADQDAPAPTPDAAKPDPSPEASANRPPTGGLTASVTSGSVPLIVTFTIDAADADGDALSFTLDFGDGSAPATGDAPADPLTHTYAAAGEFAAKLTLSDGAEEVAFEAKVTAAAAAAPEPQTEVFTGSFPVANPVGSVLFCADDGIDGDVYPFAKTQPGWTYVIEPAAGFGLYWWAGGSYVENAEVPSGTVPEGIDSVEVCNHTAVPGTAFTLTFTEPVA